MKLEWPKTGRFSCKEPNIQSLPREDIIADYEELELRMLCAMFPGKDGYGPDIYELGETDGTDSKSD